MLCTGQDKLENHNNYHNLLGKQLINFLDPYLTTSVMTIWWMAIKN